MFIPYLVFWDTFLISSQIAQEIIFIPPFMLHVDMHISINSIISEITDYELIQNMSSLPLLLSLCSCHHHLSYYTTVNSKILPLPLSFLQSILHTVDIDFFRAVKQIFFFFCVKTSKEPPITFRRKSKCSL
jgi:hypothetical protein